MSGWGTLESGGSQPDKLMEVNVTVISNAECNTAYAGAITDSMICARDDGKDSCQGDSGGIGPMPEYEHILRVQVLW